MAKGPLPFWAVWKGGRSGVTGAGGDADPGPRLLELSAAVCGRSALDENVRDNVEVSGEYRKMPIVVASTGSKRRYLL